MFEIPLEHHAKVALHVLGDNAEDIAETLPNGNWLGRRHNSGACPIAVFLTAILPGVRGVVVGSNQLTIHPVDDNEPDIDVDLPPAVAGFVLAFDIGAFPELIAPSDDAEPEI
ncbi:hypothetical protein [Actinoplanes sp. G11-F43]|uniref:hypothetical protein n=1 Tax=Actinoplanes sp. G11-F43 TaxID=3424130 RepID=UPI003D34C9C0